MPLIKMSDGNIYQVSGGFRNYVAPKGFSRVEMKDYYTPNEYLNMRYVDTISAMHAKNDPTGEKKASDHMHGKYMPGFARTSIGNMGKVIEDFDKIKSRYYTDANYNTAVDRPDMITKVVPVQIINPAQFGS